MSPSAGGVDDSVVKLQQFVALLSTSCDGVSEETEALEKEAAELGQLDDAATGKFDALGDAVGDVEDAVEHGEGDAVEDINQLGSAAQDAANDPLTTADSDIDQAESDADSHLSDGRTDVEEAASTLADEGFEAIGSKLETVTSDLNEALETTDSVFSDLDSGLDGFEQQIKQAGTEAETQFDQATGDLENQATSIETDASDSVQAFESTASDFESDAEAREGEVETFYTGLDGEITGEAEELKNDLDTLMQDTAAFVDQVGMDQISAPAEAVLNDSVEPHLAELATLQEELEAAAQTSPELTSLVDDLVKSQSVIDSIKQLLDAMEN